MVTNSWTVLVHNGTMSPDPTSTWPNSPLAATIGASPGAALLECPHCGSPLSPEHAHFRCTNCGWRDSCCD